MFNLPSSVPVDRADALGGPWSIRLPFSQASRSTPLERPSLSSPHIPSPNFYNAKSINLWLHNFCKHFKKSRYTFLNICNRIQKDILLVSVQERLEFLQASSRHQHRFRRRRRRSCRSSLAVVVVVADGESRVVGHLGSSRSSRRRCARDDHFLNNY